MHIASRVYCGIEEALKSNLPRRLIRRGAVLPARRPRVFAFISRYTNNTAEIERRGTNSELQPACNYQVEQRPHEKRPTRGAGSNRGGGVARWMRASETSLCSLPERVGGECDDDGWRADRRKQIIPSVINLMYLCVYIERENQHRAGTVV